MGTNIPAHTKGLRSTLKAVVIAVIIPDAVKYIFGTLLDKFDSTEFLLFNFNSDRFPMMIIYSE